MSMKRNSFLICILAVLLLFSCGGRGKTASALPDGDTIPLRYAENLTLVSYPDYTLATLRNPWDTLHTLHTYILVPKDRELPAHLPEGTVVRTPLSKSVIYSSVHCGLMDNLGVFSSIGGVCDLKYIKLPAVHEACRRGIIVDCGDGMNPDMERIIDLHPDAILLSPFENSGGYGRIEKLDIPIIGVVEPGARVACETTVNDRIGVIGTEATVHSGIYTSFIRRQKPDVQVVSKACPLFVPLVEEGWLKDPITMEVARRYLEELLQYDIDTLILGCTHYPLLRSTVQKIVGDKVNLVNPAYETARDLKKLLERENLSNPDTETDPSEMSHRFYVSDAADKFNKFANSILPYDIDTTQEIPIEEY